MTDKQNFEKDINVPSKRPDWRITLQADHIKRLEQDLDFERSKRKTLQTELKAKEQECEELKNRLKKIEEFRHNYCMDCEDLLKPTHSCCGCNMSILRHLVEEQI